MKIYGDAPDTVSVSMVTLPSAPGARPAPGPAGRLALTNGNEYVNTVSLRTLTTFVEIL